ncbi:hypothetical protein LOTGIDRAFT_239127 [Lottia gigantea]|uniref:Prokineticin domain-containing protein n=1 Tax=Lottia gigantea TaxID=225164 RepID=V4ALR0_LOTGI|nr:hypothetical protein LOTGIDRAFT_239127 [Lottia gigantea]ESO98057.1 hypothetical protein LOTGIDRAFT_239127 [Lottia gigantea]
MKLLVIFVVSSLCLFQVYGESKICKTSDECDVGECCAIPPLFPLMSRRAELLPPKQKDGHCRKFLVEGEYCNFINKANARDCGCADGLYCHFYPDPRIGKRKLAPGRRACEKGPKPQ